MIPAVEDAPPGHRQRTRSAASDTLFSVPALPGLADLLPLNPVPSSSPVCTPTAAPAPALDLTGFLGRAVGSGQCVALVRAAQPELGPSATWTAGAAVQGNTAIQPGTPIATFTSNRYANATDGSSHAAIYLGQDANGVQVLDQWLGSAASVRTIPWNNPGAAAANTGSAFRVVKAQAT
jgi:hypothetical protein